MSNWKVLYDRKSPRHNWRAFVTLTPELEVAFMAGPAKRARDWARGRSGWEGYEQGIAILNVSYNDIPDTLPKSTKLVGV